MEGTTRAIFRLLKGHATEGPVHDALRALNIDVFLQTAAKKRSEKCCRAVKPQLYITMSKANPDCSHRHEGLAYILQHLT